MVPAIIYVGGFPYVHTSYVLLGWVVWTLSRLTGMTPV